MAATRNERLDPANSPGPSRREFVAATAVMGGSLLLSRRLALADEPLTLEQGQPPARVVEVNSRQVLKTGTPHPEIVSEMIVAGLTSLTGSRDAEDAWRQLLPRQSKVGVKFNQSGQRALQTSAVLGIALVNSMNSAGWPPERVICVEAPEELLQTGTAVRGRAGFRDSPTNFGSGSDELASVLDQVEALVNVPFLKTHNIAGMTCCLKNLSHGLIKHPARYHANGCSPFVADIVSIPAIRDRLRLCVVDALRIVFRDGPRATPENTMTRGTLLFATDPVAADAVGLTLLNDAREAQRLDRVVAHPDQIPYLNAAHRQRLGVAMMRGIELIRLDV